MIELPINKILQGDCIEKLKELPDNSIDAIVTDPPYGLEFMGKEWDKFKNDNKRFGGGGGAVLDGGKTLFGRLTNKANSVHQYNIEEKNQLQTFMESWAKECLRVLKPGGYLLSFGGTRTYHRMTCGIEDAGFEIRDCIMWLYGSGFPKSLNIGKQIDKKGGKYVDWRDFQVWLKEHKKKSGYTNKQLDEMLGFSIKGGGMFDHFINPSQAQLPRANTYKKMKEILKLPDNFDELIEEAEREIIGKHKFDASSIYGSEIYNNRKENKIVDITLPATPEAKQWEGWGTALKPACEPIVVARKPLSERNVALNVLKWGTGGINIDACRIGNESHKVNVNDFSNIHSNNYGSGSEIKTLGYREQIGRFPANIILDEVSAEMLDEQSGASRFFYVAKTSKSERNFGMPEGEKNIHPTVKSLKLMEYLIKLVSKENAIILDPFMGSGTTAIACVKNYRWFIGIEKEPEYIKIAKARLKPYLEQNKLKEFE